MNLMRTAMLLAVMTALLMAIGYFIGGGAGMMIALIIAAGMNAFAYWNGDKMVLGIYGAREVNAQSAPEFYAIVSSLARRAALPQPRIFIIDNQQPNAFATGRSPEHAAVAATTGLLEHLTADEIAGVMAHELAHIRNHDSLTMTITATLAGAISMLGNFAFLFGGSRSADENGETRGGGIAALIAMLVAPFAAMLVQMAISRTREYAADRGGAEISGKPLALASALQKIEQIARGGAPNEDAEQHPATAPLFIINPLSGEGADSLFSTHPATANRIAALRKIAREMNAEIDGDSSGAGSADSWRPRPKWLR